MDFGQFDTRKREPSFIPKGQNWLNVPESVQDSLQALDITLVKTVAEVKRLSSIIRALEGRIIDLEESNDQLIHVLKKEQEENEKLRREFQSRPAAPPPINPDTIVSQALEEMKKAFRPEEVRTTLRKLESAVRQPNVVNRLEVLEQFRRNAMVKATTRDQSRKLQKAKLDDAIESLRKLAI